MDLVAAHGNATRRSPASSRRQPHLGDPRDDRPRAPASTSRTERTAAQASWRRARARAPVAPGRGSRRGGRPDLIRQLYFVREIPGGRQALVLTLVGRADDSTHERRRGLRASRMGGRSHATPRSTRPRPPSGAGARVALTSRPVLPTVPRATARYDFRRGCPSRRDSAAPQRQHRPRGVSLRNRRRVAPCTPPLLPPSHSPRSATPARDHPDAVHAT